MNQLPDVLPLGRADGRGNAPYTTVCWGHRLFR